MKNLILIGCTLGLLTTISAFSKKIPGTKFQTGPGDTLHYPDEKNFSNIRQLTFGADNAEAYWSYDNKYIIFQRTAPKDGIACDQMFIGKVPTSPAEKFEYRMVSSGKGRTTCGFFTRTISISSMPVPIWRGWMPACSGQGEVWKQVYGRYMTAMIFYGRSRW
jgi:hypothetical protein